MSDIKKLWLASDLDLLRKKAMQGASNAVIATEFMFLQKQVTGVQSYIPTEEDIAKKRLEMKLPPENPALAASAYILPSSKSFQVPTEEIEQSRPRQEKKQAPVKDAVRKDAAVVDYDGRAASFTERISELIQPAKAKKVSKPAKDKATTEFNGAAKEKPQEVAVKLPPELSLQFEPKMPASYKAGMKYYHPKHGIVQYAGVTKTHTSVGTFEMMKFIAGKESILIAPSKIGAQNIRMLADAKFMDCVLKAIGEKTIRGKRPVGKGMLQAKMCADILVSADPVKLAGLIYWAFKVPELKRINAAHGDKAIVRLAEEYSLIKGIDFDSAKQMFVEKSGRPTGAELLKNIESPQYMRRNAGEPSP